MAKIIFFWKYQNKVSSGCSGLDIKNFDEIMAKFWHYAKIWPGLRLLCKTINFFGIISIIFMSYIKFEILKFFGRNLAKFIAPASSILAKIKIWSYDQKKNPKKPHKTVIKIFIRDKIFLAIFLTRSSTPSKLVNLTIFVFWWDSMNQNIYKTFMMFLVFSV